MITLDTAILRKEMDSIEKKFAGDYDTVADGRVSADVVSFLQSGCKHFLEEYAYLFLFAGEQPLRSSLQYGIFHLQTGYFWVQGYTELHQLEVQHIMC